MSKAMKSHVLAKTEGVSPEYKSVILSLVSQKGKGPLKSQEIIGCVENDLKEMGVIGYRKTAGDTEAWKLIM
jgi:hypothetical protein